MKKIMNTSLIYFVLAMEWLYRTDNFRCSARAFTRHGNCTVLADRAVCKSNGLGKKFSVQKILCAL